MNLSQDTVGILKNFASINPNIVMRVGNTVKTISEAKNILAQADIREDIPVEFGIYDLNEFLNVVSLFEEPVLQFQDTKKVRVADGRQKQSVNYHFSDPTILTTPQKDITMPSIEVSFDITDSQMASLRRAASTLSVTDVVLKGTADGVTISVADIKDPTSNSYQLELDNVTRVAEDFEIMFNINNLKLIPGNYQVDISSKFISNFKHSEYSLQYWVAVEKSSTFGV